MRNFFPVVVFAQTARRQFFCVNPEWGMEDRKENWLQEKGWYPSQPHHA